MARPMLSPIDARIRALAAMHRLLASSDSFESLEDHFRQLCLHLMQALDREDVVPWVQMPNLDLLQDRAAMVALIVVELVTTVLRYSFRSEQDGTIRIDLRAKGSAAWVVVSASRLARAAPNVPSSIIVRFVGALPGHAFLNGGAEFSDGMCFPSNGRVGMSRPSTGRAR